VIDMHKDQRVYLEDPKPMIPDSPNRRRGRKRTRRVAQSKSTRVDRWRRAQPEAAWGRLTLHDSTQGELEVGPFTSGSGYGTERRSTRVSGISSYAEMSTPRVRSPTARATRPRTLRLFNSCRCRANASGSSERSTIENRPKIA
jgi:hypothetical protein